MCAASTATSPRSSSASRDAVDASDTTLLELHGVGPIVAALILAHVGDPARFATPARFASYNGTAPIEASSGPRKRHRLNPRGNRKLNHAMHLIAVTQIAPRHTRTRLLRPQTRRRQDEEGSAPRVEATHQRRGLAPTPSRPRRTAEKRVREDTQERLCNPAWPALHPEDRLFGPVTPEPDHHATPDTTPCHEGQLARARTPTSNTLLTQRGFDLRSKSPSHVAGVVDG